MYLHEEHFYLISNHAVARNTIFCDYSIQTHFKKKMELYLDPLCEILAYNLKDSEFQLLVKLKERKAFESFYTSKYVDRGHFEVPESTYIFSQAMSNLQNSLVKKFNFKYGRSGTMMAGRYERIEMTSKEEVVNQIQILNQGKTSRRYSGIWAECAMKRIDAMTSLKDYKALEMNHIGQRDEFWRDFKNNLVGNFTPSRKDTEFFKFQILNTRISNAIYKHFG